MTVVFLIYANLEFSVLLATFYEITYLNRLGDNFQC